MLTERKKRIKPKFKMGQTVYYMSTNSMCKGKIIRRTINIQQESKEWNCHSSPKIEIRYTAYYRHDFHENVKAEELFSSKAELSYYLNMHTWGE